MLIRGGASGIWRAHLQDSIALNCNMRGMVRTHVPILRRGIGNYMREGGNNATIFKGKCERKLAFPGR